MMVVFLWTGGVYRNRLQDFRARILVFVILLVQLSNETISTYRSNRLPLCNFFGQVFGQGCHLSVYRDICVTSFCCAPTGLLRGRRVVGKPGKKHEAHRAAMFLERSSWVVRCMLWRSLAQKETAPCSSFTFLPDVK